MLRSPNPIPAALPAGVPLAWENPGYHPWAEVRDTLPLTTADIQDAAERLQRFAPFIRRCFPETESTGGIIESPLTPVPAMRDFLNRTYDAGITGRLLLKRDSDLAIAGSVKARGGIYEVLKHSEDLALAEGLITTRDDYAVLATDRFRDFFHRYSIHVGSTGNLGLSIGIMSAALGFQVTVHMSADARQWKKDLLRSRGVTVVEYAGDYGTAVAEGRRRAEQDPDCYFVDDENSATLFLGYAVAAGRLEKQLQEQNIPVDPDHPLLVFLPCGVGGAPGGITFGLKHRFGDSAYCFFVEPVQAPCMLLGLASGLHSDICVQDIGLTGETHADGLAVGRPSRFVGGLMEHLLSGLFTVSDARLYEYLRGLTAGEHLFIEPSACAAFEGPVRLHALEHLLTAGGLTPDRLENATLIAWATGGRLVPEAERQQYLATYL